MARNGTDLDFLDGSKGLPATAVLIVPITSEPRPPLRQLAAVDECCDGAVSRVLEVGTLREDPGHLLHGAAHAPKRRVVLVSLGAAEKLSPQRVRQAAAAATRWLVSERVGQAAVWVDGLVNCGVETAREEWVAGSIVAAFRYGEQRAADDKGVDRTRVTLCGSQAEYVRSAMGRVREATIIAAAVNEARRLAHQPANVMTPAALAKEAKALAQRNGMRCEVLGEAPLKRMKMGGLLGVGIGAAEKPCLIRIDYRGAPKSRENIVLVGKAITFDTGGYSIKPADGMEKMKFDKCGGCDVLGILQAAARLKLKCNLTGLIAAAENAISGDAYRPGDILRMASGKTVEVISTDAEGRLVLADALWYAQEHCEPTTMIDLATLTGGINVALGKLAAGLMANDDGLAAELEESGRRTHERLWRLPLWDDYRDLIKGHDSDIRNSAGKRDAHAIVGGMFLREFVSAEVPWAHLDIAAVATTDDGRAATGFGVRLVLDFLRRRIG